MQATELIKRYAAGERDFPGIDLSFANLSQVNLSGANLSRANLQGANLQQADLSWVTLYGAHLESANLTDASLYRANMQRAKLYKAKLKGADLRAVDLTDAELMAADLSDADLWGANLPRSAHLKLEQTTSHPSGTLHEWVKHLNIAKLIKQVFGRPEKPLRREFNEYPSFENGPPNLQATERIVLETDTPESLRGSALAGSHSGDCPDSVQ